jgi:hypothetical protein
MEFGIWYLGYEVLSTMYQVQSMGYLVCGIWGTKY